MDQISSKYPIRNHKKEQDIIYNAHFVEIVEEPFK